MCKQLQTAASSEESGESEAFLAEHSLNMQKNGHTPRCHPHFIAPPLQLSPPFQLPSPISLVHAEVTTRTSSKLSTHDKHHGLYTRWPRKTWRLTLQNNLVDF